MSKLTPFEYGQIKAHMHHGLKAADIVKIVTRMDGSGFSHPTIVAAIEKLDSNKHFRGERAEGSGRPRKTSVSVDKKIYKEVLKGRGKHKVTVTFLKKSIPHLRHLSNTLVEERLHEAGLQYLRRRRKTIVPSQYIKSRLAYCRWILKQRRQTLEQFAYSNGTVFYLDRTAADNEHTQQAALGSHVWRHADRSDALFHEVIGPSGYNKAQGAPVRVWGLLTDGFLHVHVLDEGEVMDTALYSWLVEEKFADWMQSTKYLVQDFEKCLRTAGSLEAMKRAGIVLVQQYPKCSQDFNAIENCWKELRDRLYATLPVGLEAREAFIRRLRAAVLWLNRNRAEQMFYLSTNQKERARDCLCGTKGGRTKW